MKKRVGRWRRVRRGRVLNGRKSVIRLGLLSVDVDVDTDTDMGKATSNSSKASTG